MVLSLWPLPLPLPPLVLVLLPLPLSLLVLLPPLLVGTKQGRRWQCGPLSPTAMPRPQGDEASLPPWYQVCGSLQAPDTSTTPGSCSRASLTRAHPPLPGDDMLTSTITFADSSAATAAAAAAAAGEPVMEQTPALPTTIS
jgi:hypothetical protein